jgi:16S rRNA (uracil1498-N3)-methyltransferase
MKSQRPPPRLLLDEPINGRRQLTLSAAQANYLQRALRLRVAAPLIIFDGCGAEHQARILRYEKGGAVVELGVAISAMAPPDLRVFLVQGIAKAERMDFAIQKATELGVAEIFPAYTHHSVVKLDRDRALRRLIHWQRVAGSACEQSGRHFPPRVHGPQPLDACIRALPAGCLRLVFDPRGAKPWPAQEPDSVAALVGPEGGFSAAELDTLTRSGFRALKLGEQILRTETAAVVACALLQSRWGNLRG